MPFLNKEVLMNTKQLVDPELVPMLDQVLSLMPSFSPTMENIPQMRASQMETELHVYPGAFHGFQMVPNGQVTQAFNRDCLGALTRALKQS
jgi:acetyl esterase/lipase